MMSKTRILIFLVPLFLFILFPQIATAKVKVNIGSVYGPGAPVHFGLEKFKELAEARSNKEIEVLIHVGGAMGGERDVFEAMSTGALEMGAMGSGDIAIFFPKYLAYEVPYVFRDVDHFWKFWNGPVGKEINDMLIEKKNVMTVGIVYRGARYLTANRPIRTPEDVKGLKLRLPEVKVWIKIWESLGALPVVVAFPEVYMALKTGIAEAQENPLESIYSYKFYEAQKYLIATRHVHATCKYQISKIWFDKLSPDHQKLILQAWKEATDYANNMALEFDAKLLKDLQARGMILIEPDVAAFRAKVYPVLEELAKTFWVPGLYERIIAIK